MANVSANTLFHFTSSIKNIESILRDEFLLKYCRDDWRSCIDSEMKNPAFPMICFCDIPLSQIQNHISKYGGYGIGLKKEWGVKNNITPVMYIHNNSSPMSHLESITQYLLSKHENALSLSPTVTKPEKEAFLNDPFLKNMQNIIAYCKPYQGKMWDKEKKQFNGDIQNFYEEREWRYTPEINPQMLLFDEDFSGKSKNKLSQYKLPFEPHDIKYIIVKESEIPEMIKKVKEIKSPKYKPDDIELLITRIISMEHILADF